MKLNNAVLSQSLPGYALPQYDRQAMARRSRQQPHLAALWGGQPVPGLPGGAGPAAAQRRGNGHRRPLLRGLRHRRRHPVFVPLRRLDPLRQPAGRRFHGEGSGGLHRPKLDLAPGPLPGGGNLPGSQLADGVLHHHGEGLRRKCRREGGHGPRPRGGPDAAGRLGSLLPGPV